MVLDIEKVTKGLECCTSRMCCAECPYYSGSFDVRCLNALKTDALKAIEYLDTEHPFTRTLRHMLNKKGK